MKWTAERLRARAEDMRSTANSMWLLAQNVNLDFGMRYAAAVEADAADDLANDFESLASRREKQGTKP